MTMQSSDDILDVVADRIISGEIGLHDMYGCRLRDLVGLAKRHGHHALARCVAAIAVGYRDRRLDVIEKALCHGLAIADIDLPFGPPPIVETESAYLSARFREIGHSVPASVIDTWDDDRRKTAEQQIEARRLWKRRLSPEEGEQLSRAGATPGHLTVHMVTRVARELKNAGCPVPTETIVCWTTEKYVQARRWLDRYHRWQHDQRMRPVAWATEEAHVAVAVPDEQPEAPEFLRAYAQGDAANPCEEPAT